MVHASRLAATMALAASSSCSAFGNDGGIVVRRAPPSSSSSSSSAAMMIMMTTTTTTTNDDDDDATARAMSEYMARSHEEKLRAIKEVEMKKNAEIEALRAELDSLKSSSALAAVAAPTMLPVATTVVEEDTSDIQMKLASYQNFMASYIVSAQNQKLLAVKEAELKAERKFQERLERLLLSSGGGTMSMESVVDASAAVTNADAATMANATPYQKRNAGILSAAAAGKSSRWGDMEIERASSLARRQQQRQSGDIVPTPTPATGSSAAVVTTAYDMRNARVIASAGAGTSRWGNMEVERAIKTTMEATNDGASSSATPPPAAVATTPVVVRNGRSNVSLEDRLNLGARLLDGGGSVVVPSAPAPAARAPSTSFDLRNSRVIASAGVGKSRWGDMEIERIAMMGKYSSSVATAAGGKSSVSVEDRVNLGARLLDARV
ncbi:hypothetical protein ACHAXA_008555 [Cyclostephanos tholiformis]|uniref:Uncharacterized protein n=1 Tax=Cyclostephanos tholiformis TaxID=382380 RepID=A0ABD3REG2_9STRA